MKSVICRFCRKSFLTESNSKFCSKVCEIKNKEAVYTTISLKHVVRNRIIDIQNDILKKINRKVSYNDIIDYMVDVMEKTVGKDKFIDKIINEHYKY
ncbi:hypothetical protein LCGC14_2249150 [marine sediment metagenome]|uniref:Uncharacterized protein n=1 Tax=marine sediment metagenome TaxID=412755 RepID=A0A0F9FY28_9ZZZZ